MNSILSWYFVDCFSKNIDNIILFISLFISIYLFPLLLGLLLKIKYSSIQPICLSRVPTSTFALTSCVTFKCILNLVLLTTSPDQISYRKHSRMKKFIFLVFLLFPLLTRFIHALPFSCLHPMAFATYPSLIKKKLGKVLTKLNTTYLNLRLASLSILLIVLCNPSIINPGPTKLNGIKCYFQNVQGLVTFSSLGKPFPNLNQTKICELQAHIFETSPDIVILNETWLKPTIKSNEILPTKIYKIFRLDRSIKSHPPDSDNPQKFRTNGGGVLIGVKESLNLKPKLVDQTCCAEVLSIQLSLPNKKKICLSTAYILLYHW